MTGGRTYRFRITANLTGADSAVSNIVSGTTDAFVQPVLNNPTVLSTTAMDLAWNNVSGNTGYKLERKLGSGGTYAQIGGNLAPNTVIYHDSGLSAGGTYYYRVSILNSVTGTSNEVNAITLPAAPNLSAPTGIASSQMTLTWGNITGNAGYKIERSTDNATWTQVATPATDATTSTISGLSSGTLYYFRIRATNASGDSAYSSSVSAKTKLQTPTMNAPTAASATQIDLSWSDVNGGGGVNETGFTIEYAPCNNSTPAACSDPVNGAYWGGWVTTTAVADATTKSITGLTGGRTYRFRITANLAGADSATSNIVSGTTTSFVQPVLNTPTVLSTTAMDLAWNNVSGNTGYKLERKLGSGGTYAQIGGNLATDTVIYHDTGLSAGTTYYYRVSILNSVSGTSNEVSAITLPAAPNPSAPTGITSSQMTLSWVNITGNAGYKIERSTDNATWTQIATPATDATTSTISGLSSGTLYYFRIRSTNISGDSAYSSSVSAKTKLQTPTMNAPTAASTTQIDLSWADPNGGGGVNETGFTIEYAPCNNSTPATCSDPVNGAYWGAWVTTTAAADATTKSIAGLTGGRTYRFRITANLTGADSAVSTIVSGTTTSFVQPVLDNPTVLSTTTMDVAWNNVSGNTGYKLERKLGSGGTYAQIGGNLAADTVIYHDSGLTPGTTYYYRVSVLNSVSGTSNEVSAITLPIAPTLNAPSGITPSQINLSWANITGNTGYKLERSSDNVTWSEIATPAQNAVGYSDTAVTSGTLYYYRIRATNASGDSAYSATVSAKAKLNSPVLSSATASSTTQVALVWTDVNGSSGADETGITIEYSLCSNLDPLSCSDANGSYWGSWSSTTAAADSTSFTIGSLVTGRSYRFRVTATLSGANSDPSGMLVATTYITAPSDLTATVSSTSSMTLSWTDIAGETNYKVEQDGTLLPGITLAKNSNTYTVNSLGLNTQYCFRVQPYNSTSSAFSNQACATIYGPTTLNSVTAGAGPRIDLGWADVDGESGYEVWQSTAVNQSSPPAGVGTGSWNTYTNLTATPLTTNTISYGITSGLTAGYTYKYQVRYKLPDNTYSPYSNEMMVTTIPPTPASFTGSVASSSQVNLSWTDGYGESAYNVQYKVRAGSFCSSEDWTGVSSNAVAANANSYSATGLTPGAIYCFRMNASNSSGSSAWTTVATYIALLDAPTLNAPSNIGQMTLDLSWNNLTGNTGYKIERSTSNTFAVNLTTFTVVANTTTYTDIGLTPGQTYYYRISAKNAADVYSAASGTQSATTLVVPSPVLDALSGVTFSKIDLSWGNVAGNVGYRLERSTASNFAANLVTTPLGANVTSYSDTTVNGNTTYYYRVSTQNSGNFYSDPSSVQSTTTPVITVPTLNALSGITQVSIDLSWGNIAGNNGYKIERSLYSSFSSVTTINVVANASTYTDSGLIPNKTYYYRIYTKNSGGFYSAASSSKSGTTLTVTSPAITFSGVTQTQATLSWIDVPGNTGYYVDRIMPYGWWGLAADLGAGVTTWTDTGLTTGTTYTYRARSKNGSYGASYTVTTITAAPTAPTLSAVSESQIDLAWQTVQGGTGYKVMRSVGPDGPWNEVLNVTAPYSTLYCGLYANPTIGCSSIPAYTSTSDTGLSENTQYCYQLKATSSGGDSALSGTACQKTLSVGGPTVTSVTALNSMVIKVDWAYNPASCTPVPCSNPDAFEVDIKLWNGEWMRKGLVNGSTFTFTDTKGIQPAKSYSYRVRAVAGAELSAYSNQVSITTPAFRSVDGTCR